MGFDYKHLKKKYEDAHSNWWTSYADLFMMLSVVFLLMYVASSLRSGSLGYNQQLEYNELSKQNHDLKEQIKVYNALKDKEIQAKGEQEQEVYAKLMDKLKLLQDEARTEKESLRRQAKENEEKEFALNQYQQLVRNIINANILAKAQIKRREEIIQSNAETIESQEETIAEQRETIRQKEKVIADNTGKIRNINTELARKIDLLKRERQSANLTKSEMEKRIARLKQESAKKVSELRALSEEAAEELQEARAAISQTQTQLTQARGTIVAQEQEKGRIAAQVEGLKKEKAVIQGDLDKARSMANARKDLAKSIQAAFNKAGIKADVNPGTGEVTLDFGEEYFDTGSSKIKPLMRDKLNKFFPTYTRSLFDSQKTAEKIGSIELVGFASSTYKGKYVNPTSVKPEDQEAVSFNLKLSFARAQEIFKHVYSNSNLHDAQKKKLLPLVKVVGRGYLPEGAKAADIPAGISEEKFCQTYNCKKAQKVVVKFNFKD